MPIPDIEISLRNLLLRLSDLRYIRSSEKSHEINEICRSFIKDNFIWLHVESQILSDRRIWEEDRDALKTYIYDKLNREMAIHIKPNNIITTYPLENIQSYRLEMDDLITIKHSYLLPKENVIKSTLE